MDRRCCDVDSVESRESAGRLGLERRASKQARPGLDHALRSWHKVNLLNAHIMPNPHL